MQITKMPMMSSVLRTAKHAIPAAALVILGVCSKASGQAINVESMVQDHGHRIEDTTLMIKRQSDGQLWVSNPKRAKQRFSPASTSKIPHTLIALDSGVATPDTVFKWDGVRRSVRAWNSDHTLPSAFETSAVWVYQQIARTAGQQTMSDGLDRLEYGNATVGSIDHLTTYWLDGTLRISAAGQIKFLSRLAQEHLPISRATYAAAKAIMVSDQTDRWVMRSKTGWRYNKNGMDIGWFVGWLDCGPETYVFAMNLDMPDTRYLSKRKEITYAVLRDIGAFDCAG